MDVEVSVEGTGNTKFFLTIIIIKFYLLMQFTEKRQNKKKLYTGSTGFCEVQNIKINIMRDVKIPRRKLIIYTAY